VQEKLQMFVPSLQRLGWRRKRSAGL